MPRNTSVIARRLPPSRPGRGNAQFYMASTSSAPASRASGPPSRNGAPGVKAGHVSRRFDGREDSAPRSTVGIMRGMHAENPDFRFVCSPPQQLLCRLLLPPALMVAMRRQRSQQCWRKRMSNGRLPRRRCRREPLEHPLLLDTLTSTCRATKVPFNHKPGAGGSKPASTAPDRPVPGNYICHRCGQPGE